MTPGSLDQSERVVVGRALALIRALSRAGQATTQMPRLWIVTRNTQAATTDSPPIEPLQAMLWGLGRTVALEHPKFWGGLIDLAAPGASADAEALLREFFAPDGEGQVAIRPAGRLAARFMRLPPGPTRGGPLFREDATYLITGGLGSLGLKVAEWMADRGARQLVLTSRRGAHADAEQVIRTIEAKGTRVVVAVGDITKEAELARILHEVRTTMPSLCGVFHCAGMLDDGVLDQMNWSRFAAVTAPKVKGSWMLHRATLGDELDYFVLFSSVLSLLGSAGQANYTSGNAFLDALTEHRRTAGRPAVALNWGPWAETGLATASGSRGEAIWKSRGTGYIPPDAGVAVLEHVLRRGVGHAAVTITDWRQFLDQFAVPVPFYEVLEQEAGPRRKRRGAGHDAQATRDRIEAARGSERRDLVVAVVRQEASDLLGVDEALDPNRPLDQLGLDSLMAVSLVNRLEPALGVPVPMASLLRVPGPGPSITELVDSLFPDQANAASREVEVKAASAHVEPLRDGQGGRVVRVEPDVVYGRRDGMALTFDVIRAARPSGAGVLWIQSARWRSTWVDPKVWPVLAKLFLDRGLTVFIVRHRSAPLYSMPEIVEDVRLSVRFIRLKAERLGIDPERLSVFGNSAGGHLALMLGTTGDDGDPSAKEEVLRQSSRVAAVIAVAPPTDLRDWVTSPSQEIESITASKTRRLFDARTAPNCSPVLHVSNNTAPTLLIHGDQDELVPIDHSRKMLSALKKSDVASELMIFEGGGHIFNQEQIQDFALPATLSWLDQQLVERKANATL